MPSTVVHVALAGLVATALLDEHFDGKAVLVVMGAVAFIDLDVLVGLVLPGTHRAAFHTLLLPLLLGAVFYYDLRMRGRGGERKDEHARGDERERGDGHERGDERAGSPSRSWVRARWGARGVRIGWVSLVAVTLAGIAPDAFFNGVNLFYPLHDRFYDLSGQLLYSNQRGLVQTFVEFDFWTEEAAASGEGGGGGETVRTTENTHYRTGVDPSKGQESANVERIFPIAMTGERFALALTGYCVVGLRLWTERRN